MTKPMRLHAMREALRRWLKTNTPDKAAERDEFISTQKNFGADFTTLSSLYLVDSSKRIVSLTEAVAEKNAARIATVAHSLSGSCISMGAKKLAALCQTLEMQTKAGQLDNIEEKLSSISSEYARVDTKLQSMMRSEKLK